ncbi:flagellar filament capping protein FliD [Variovorax sp. HJSM1_2]|uniref:flagellar filament capping protein FliD n=1 Tax=Variovorax sp. HJSM1_2 TaxID=3366263 RepID=UPI003BE660CE
MGISSVGIGSGLDVQGIISKLVALEKSPLTTLEAKATIVQSKISAYGEIKSLMTTLSDAAGVLSRDSGWNAMTLSSSSSAVGATVTGIASASSFSVGVSQLAQSQSTVSGVVAANTDMSGTIAIQLGSWTTTPGVPPTPTAFTADPTKTEIKIVIPANTTSLAAVAAKINDAGAGVTATVISDASGDRLMIRSSSTGEVSGFKITAPTGAGLEADEPEASAGLKALTFDPENAATGTTMTQAAQNAKATINGVSVSSATNELKSVIPGVALQLTQVTTSDALVTVKADTATIKKNIQAFVDAYNAVNTLLGDATKYDDTAKTAGILQGDSATVGLQNMLRRMITSTSMGDTLTRLSDVGITMQQGGNLSIETLTTAQKALGRVDLDTALAGDLTVLKQLFAGTDGDATSKGIAVKIKTFASDLLALDGGITAKQDALDSEIERNDEEQDKVNNRATLLEARLTKTYSALDAKMATLTALSDYVTQQVAQWNKKD